MADIRISDMVPATAFADTDVVAGLQGLGNVKITRDIFLSALAGELIFLTGNGSTVKIDGAGAVTVDLGSAKQFFITGNAGSILRINGDDGDTLIQTVGAAAFEVDTGSGAVFQMDGSGNITFGGNTVLLTDGLATISLPGNGDVVLTPKAGAQCIVSYLDTTGGAWQTSSPANTDDAINRIAAFLKAQIGAIP